MEEPSFTALHREPWNKGKLVGQKAPLKLKDIWAIRVLQLANRARDLGLFNLAIDSKLRACGLVKLLYTWCCRSRGIAGRRKELTKSYPALDKNDSNNKSLDYTPLMQQCVSPMKTREIHRDLHCDLH